MSQDYTLENISDYTLHTVPDARDDNAVHHIQTDDPAESSGSLMEVGDTPIDITDGFFTDLGYNVIKGVVTVVLQHIINVKLKEECLGCEIDHPSQMQHSCLFEPTSYYFASHFLEFSRKLFKDKLYHLAASALQRSGFKADTRTIQGAACAIYYELKDEPYIVAKLEEIRQSLLNNDTDKLFCDVVNTWYSPTDSDKDVGTDASKA